MGPQNVLRHTGFAVVFLGLLSGVSALNGKKPHIIIILADDLGFNDVSYNAVDGSAIETPNIDDLAANGVKLGNYYVQPQCTPTRSTLLTGRYVIHTGMQHNIIGDNEPACLPLSEVTMTDKLHDAGYATHMVGKWHLGFYAPECTPTYRGFDSFLGIYLSGGGYYDHDQTNVNNGVTQSGKDFRNGTAAAWDDYEGQYATTIYDNTAQDIIEAHATDNVDKPLFLYVAMQAPHTPLEVDDEYRRIYRGKITNRNRKYIAGMISAMDESIGHIVQSLKDNGLYDDSVILFSSDNGAAIQYSNNWPLRGGKNTIFEGGIRTVGVLHSPLLPDDVIGTTSNALIHVSDWFPTFVSSLAEASVDADVDGEDMWTAITTGDDSTSTTRTLLHNIDPLKTRGDADSTYDFDISIHAALRKGHMKVITGNPGSDDGWTAPVESSTVSSITSSDSDSKRLWLFNITADPTEETDLSEDSTYSDILEDMLTELKSFCDSSVDVIDERGDTSFDPSTLGWYSWGVAGDVPTIHTSSPRECYRT